MKVVGTGRQHYAIGLTSGSGLQAIELGLN